jgi:hypothetical protein
MNKETNRAIYKEIRTVVVNTSAEPLVLSSGTLGYTSTFNAPSSHVVNSSPGRSAPQNARTLTTTDLIAELQQIEKSYGNLPVCIEATTAIRLRDEDSNPVNTMAAQVEGADY